MAVLGVLVATGVAKPALTVTRIESPTFNKERAASAQLESDPSGTTSFRFSTTKTLKPAPEGVKFEVPSYLTRDRDLGQVFVAEESGVVQRLILRVGPTETAVGAHAEGAEIFVQWFEVSGTARINQNRTTDGKVVGWTDDPRADDFLEGERYRSAGLFRGGILPSLGPGDWFEIQFNGRAPRLGKGKRYGFLIGFEKAGPDRSLALANLYWGRLGPDDATVRLNHGIRREGSPMPDPYFYPERVVPPPGMAKDTFPPNYDRWWWRPSLPAVFSTRIKQTPGTVGRPDVDTWRELTHVIVLR